MELALELVCGKLYLLHAPRSFIRRSVSVILAGYALSTEVRVLDGGNLIDLYGLGREVRRRTEDVSAAMQRIYVARAFTCYQMTALLCSSVNLHQPIVVLELLDTFYDENASLFERTRLLETCLAQLRRLSREIPTLVTSGTTSGGRGDTLFERLQEAADHVWQLEPNLHSSQARLF